MIVLCAQMPDLSTVQTRRTAEIGPAIIELAFVFSPSCSWKTPGLYCRHPAKNNAAIINTIFIESRRTLLSCYLDAMT
jgi:hypothetical protein